LRRTAFLPGYGGAGAIGLPIDTPDFTPGSLHKTIPATGRCILQYVLFSSEFKQIDPLTIIGNIRKLQAQIFLRSGIEQLDIALVKDTLIREGMNLEFRTELFNASITLNLPAGWEHH